MHLRVKFVLFLLSLVFSLNCAMFLFTQYLRIFFSPKDTGDTNFLKITGGQNVQDETEFPFQLRLLENGQVSCGAAILDDKIGITAAHCLAKNPHPGSYEVYAGLRDWTARESLKVQKRYLKNLVVHPQFDPVTMQNDIALFQVVNNFIFNKWVNRIRIPGNLSLSLYETRGDNQMVIASGWGYDESQKNPDILQKVRMPLMPREQCQKYFGPKILIDETMICAGEPKSGRDTCQGDSGGPLILDDPPSLTPLLVGVTSWGWGCGKDTPGVYTNVRLYSNWIQEQSSQF